MAAHTPGPWVVQREWAEDGDGSEVESYEVLSATGEPIFDQPATLADVRLAAAAPDLLKALETLLVLRNRDTYAAARAAIAKATGEQR